MSKIEEVDELLDLLEKKEKEIHYNKISTMFPDSGRYRRELYKPHIKFIQASSQYSQLAFIAANRIGKTLTGAYIMTCHLTGIYPHWWKGKRFLNPIRAWASGTTNSKTKEIQQFETMGPDDDIGAGMIPKHLITGMSKKAGLTDAYEKVEVKHVSGGTSVLTFKSYEQGRKGFEGTKQQVIWLDEEPDDESIYSECVMRLTDEFNPGILLCTFTPLAGVKGIALKFLPDLYANKDGSVQDQPDMFAIQATWDDVPHLTESDKRRMLDACLPHERVARSRGIPSLSSGVIYPFFEDQIIVDPIPIPEWWPKAYGLDTGFKCTAAVWGAIDPDSNSVYIFNEYIGGEMHLAVHAHAIRARGEWMTGAADAMSISQVDGAKTIDLYIEEGLNLIKADKRDVDSGILKVHTMFETGLLKIFNTCQNLIKTIRKYHRDEKGRIVKKDDHLPDALRYLIKTGLDYADTPPYTKSAGDEDNSSQNRNRYTGY